MLIVPAICIQDGRCVCGSNYEPYKLVSDDPVDMAGRWMDRGAPLVHVLDLDGAQSGLPVNQDLIVQIAQRFPNLPLRVEGGISDLATIERYIKSGVNELVLGIQVAQDSKFVEGLCRAFPEKISFAMQRKEGKLISSDSDGQSKLPAAELIRSLAGKNIQSLIYRDLDSAGKAEGVNIDAITKLADVLSIPLVVSGGVTNMDDIRELYCEADKGITGVIVNRAFYDETLDLAEAQLYCEE